MSILASVKDGITLAHESAHVVRSNPYLLIFWAIPFVATIASNILLEPHITIRISIICLSTFFTACFMHAYNHTLEHRTRSIMQIISSCAKRIHLLLIWGLITAVFYELVNVEIADPSWPLFIMRWLLFLAWPISTFYLLPIIALEHEPITRIAQLTVHLLKNTIWEVIGGSFYCALILLPGGLLNALTIALLYYQHIHLARICALLAICFIYLLNIMYAAFRTTLFYEEYKKPLDEVDVWQMPMA